MNIKKISLLFLALLFVFISNASAQDSLKILPSNPMQNTASVYTLSFVTTDTLLPDAQIEITLPDDFDLSNVRIANSTTINGGFNAMVNGSKIVLQRKGRGKIILPREKVDIQFGLVLNPTIPLVEFPMIIAIKNEVEIEKQKIKQVKILFSEKRIENKKKTRANF